MSEFLAHLAGAALSGGGSGGGLGGILGQLMGGGAPTQQQPMPQPTANGFGGFLGQLRQGGLGQQVDSWVGSGPNQQVTPQQLGQALGGHNLDQMAQSAGMDRNGLLGMLSGALPHVVNGMTPNGQMPQNDTQMPQGGMHGFLGSLFGGQGGAMPQQGGMPMGVNAAYDAGGGQSGGENYDRKMAAMQQGGGYQGGEGDNYARKIAGMEGGQKS